MSNSKTMIVVNGINIEVERKMIKHIHLSVYPPDGRIHISAPASVGDDQLRLFVLSKWVWLMEKQEEATQHNIQPKREYVSGEAHYYKGQLFRLRVDICQNEQQRVVIEGDYLVVKCKRRENAEYLLAEWYRIRLKEIIPPLLSRWCKRIGTEIPSYEILQMNKRWGSCNPKAKHIVFNLELAKKPIEGIEYIVAHEVIHLLERTHTDRFFRLLATFLPKWEKLKDELNEYPVSIE